MVVTPLPTLVEERRERVLTAFHKAERELSEPLVHDLRVACRRLDSALQILPGTDKLRKRLRKLRSLAGDLRDLHVLRDWLTPQVKEWPLLRPIVKEQLPRWIERETRRLERKLDDFKLKKLKKPFDSEPASEEAVLEICRERAQAFRRALAERSDWHDVRVALKHYRYTAELVEALGLDRIDLDELKTWQDRLGKIHDLEVHAATLSELAIPAFVQHCRAERDRLIGEL